MNSRKVAVGLRSVDSDLASLASNLRQAWSSLSGEVTGQIWNRGDVLYVQPICQEVANTAAVVRERTALLEGLLSELDG